MTITKLTKKDKIEFIVAAVLVLVFLILLGAFLQRGKIRNRGTAAVGKTSLPNGEHFELDPKRHTGMSFILEKSSGDITGAQRDPFSFGSQSDNSVIGVSDLYLKGIMWNPESPSAIINDQVLKIGESISGFKVAQILQDSVVVENDTSRLELKLNQ